MSTASSNGQIKINVKRRTNLSDARKHAILGKMRLFYVELAAELGESPDVLDLALTGLAQLSAQATFEGLDYTFPAPGDSLEAMREKCRAYLTEVNPAVRVQAERLLSEADATWNDPALLPTPPETDEKNG